VPHTLWGCSLACATATPLFAFASSFARSLRRALCRVPCVCWGTAVRRSAVLASQYVLECVSTSLAARSRRGILLPELPRAVRALAGPPCVRGRCREAALRVSAAVPIRFLLALHAPSGLSSHGDHSVPVFSIHVAAWLVFPRHTCVNHGRTHEAA
jgi:hypothetical protein